MVVLLIAVLPGCGEPDPSLAFEASSSGGPVRSQGEEAQGPLACVRETHHPEAGIAIFGCADQAAAVRSSPGAEPLPDVDLQLAVDASMPIEPGKRLHDCEWSSFIDTAKAMLVICPGEKHIVSGGCMSQTQMLVSAPWENNTVGDLPENGERYQDVGAPNGWLCIYEDPAPSGQIATALCCE